MTKPLAPLLIALSVLLPLPAPAADAQAPAADVPPPAAAPEAAPAPEASLTEMIKALSRFLTEEEIQLVYDYLWDSSLAALKGDPEPVELPPELAFKLAILQQRIVKEGGHYLAGLASRMEKDLAHWREQMLTPPPPPTYQLPSERAQPVQAQPAQPAPAQP